MENGERERIQSSDTLATYASFLTSDEETPNSINGGETLAHGDNDNSASDAMEKEEETLDCRGDDEAEAIEEEEEAVVHPVVHFMETGIRRRATVLGGCIGDYVGVDSDPCISKILGKQGDTTVLFADTVLKLTGSGKLKRRTLIITAFAMYLIDTVAVSLKRRIALSVIDKLCLSELNDNFLAIIVPTEYDCFIASTRKTEIVCVLLEATMRTSAYDLEVDSSNSFVYHTAADTVNEVHFEEVDGGVKMRFNKRKIESQ